MNETTDTRHKLFTPYGVFDTEEDAQRAEWRARIATERQHQIDDGFDAEHDAAHGIRHFLAWAQDYSRRGRPLAAAALVEVALDRMAVLRAYVDDPGNRSTLDGRRAHLLGLIDGVRESDACPVEREP